MSGAPALTRDAFLGGRLHLWQPAQGYRAGIDPVFLAAAVPARPGERVLELGCGVGAASLCLGLRVAGLRLTGLEVQAEAAELARSNASEAGLALEVVRGDVADRAVLAERAFEHVAMNPPYFRAGAGSSAASEGREAARREAAPLAEWVRAAHRRLLPGGTLTAIHLAARLDELLAVFDGRFGGVEIMPLAPREGRDATRIVVIARKGSRAPLRLAAPLILHAGMRHEDGAGFGAAAQHVLRDGASLTDALDKAYGGTARPLRTSTYRS